MGLDIGSISRGSDLYVRPASTRERSTQRTPTFPASDSRDTVQFFQRGEEEPIPRVGFGAGTVSTGQAAVRALNRNFESARRIVPTPEEQQEAVRERVEQDRERVFAENTRDIAPPDALGERQRAEAQAVNRSRDLVNDLNRASEIAQARLSGNAPPERPAPTSIRIGNESIAFRREASFQRQSNETPRFDISV